MKTSSCPNNKRELAFEEGPVPNAINKKNADQLLMPF